MLIALGLLPGGNGHLAVILGSYQPSVICTGTLPLWRSCNAALYGMEATRQEQVFGDASDPHSQVGLPAEINSGKDIALAALFFIRLSGAD